MKQLRNLLSKTKFPRGAPAMRLNQSGQSLIILAFAFLGLIAMLGLALDMGLVYVERIRLKRTVDAAALAAVTELPVEEEAARRALGYLQENGYDITRSNVFIAGCVQDVQDKFNSTTGGQAPDGITDSLVNLPPLPAGGWDELLPEANQTLTPDPNPDAEDYLSFYASQFYHYFTYDPNSDGRYEKTEAPAFFIDTRSYQERSEADGLCDVNEQVSGNASSYGSAVKIKVHGMVPVRMNFMQFFGFDVVMVSDSATAENSSTLDVVVVLDTTGSMEFDTICYGCWARCGDGTQGHNGNNAFAITDCNALDKYFPYPGNGRTWQYGYYGATLQNLICGQGLCGESDPLLPPEPETGDNYMVLEAEFYTNNFSSWEPAYRSAGKGYWAIQRDWEAKAFSIDGYGYGGAPADPSGDGTRRFSGLVRHHPYLTSNGGNPFGRNYTLAEAENGIAPLLEYDFTPSWGGVPTYIHFRAQKYSGNTFYWTIAKRNTQVVDGKQVLTTDPPLFNIQTRSGGASNSSWNPRNNWSWISVNTGGLPNTPLTQGQRYTLQVWAGSAGYAFDRIIITSRSDIDDSPGPDLRGLPATPGSVQGIAADPCNPIYGLTVLPANCTHMTIFQPINNLDNPLFSALDPIRGAQNAIRNFVLRLDPKLDQAGFVDFAADGWQRSQLECIRASRARDAVVADDFQQANYPLDASAYGEFDETVCFDADQAIVNTAPISYNNVFIAIEDAYPPSGNTDIADGLRRGLHMMGINTDNDDGGNHSNDCNWNYNSGNWRLPRLNGAWLNQPGIDSKSNPIVSHCARGQAATGIIVLLTDGAPTNNDPGDNADCDNEAISPLPYEGFPDTDKRYRCIMYYTDIAAKHGVLVYTIGLGVGADQDLMKAVAEKTNGQAYFVLTASQLDVIFDQILANVYIRLIE